MYMKRTSVESLSTESKWEHYINTSKTFKNYGKVECSTSPWKSTKGIEEIHLVQIS